MTPIIVIPVAILSAAAKVLVAAAAKLNINFVKKNFVSSLVFGLLMGAGLSVMAQEVQEIQSLKTHQNPLVFTPLPQENEAVTIARSLPLAKEMARVLGREVKVKFYQSYSDIMEAFLKEEVDIVQLTPLNYIALDSTSASFQHIAFIRSAKEQQDYRCVLVAPMDGIQNLTDLKRVEKPNVLLTQPFSTCGWVAADRFFREAGLTLSEHAVHYKGGHDSLALALLRNEGSVGCVADYIAERFEGLGLSVLKEGAPSPMPALVANSKKILPTALEALEAHLLTLPDETLNTLGLGRFGFVIFEQQQMDEFTEKVAEMNSGNRSLNTLTSLEVAP